MLRPIMEVGGSAAGLFLFLCLIPELRSLVSEHLDIIHALFAIWVTTLFIAITFRTIAITFRTIVRVSKQVHLILFSPRADTTIQPDPQDREIKSHVVVPLGRREGELIRRIKPPYGNSHKLNTDGSAKGNPNSTTSGAGGLIRDETGNWVCVFFRNLGSSSSDVAELHAVIIGIRMARKLGIRKLDVEVDSEEVFKRLTPDDPRPKVDPADKNKEDLDAELRKLLDSPEMSFQHRQIPREGNFYAHWFAELACEASSSDLLNVFYNAPHGLIPHP